MLSKKTSQELWFIIVRMGRMVRPFRGPHVHDEGGKALGLLRHLVARGGAGQQQHQVGMLGARGPDLLAVHHPLVALADGGGAQRRGVGPAVGSVTPKAWRRSVPSAMPGRYFAFCSGCHAAGWCP
jgi:hypothetical protein